MVGLPPAAGVVDVAQAVQTRAGRWRGPGTAFALSLAVHVALLGAAGWLLGSPAGTSPHGPTLAVELAAAPAAATLPMRDRRPVPATPTVAPQAAPTAAATDVTDIAPAPRVAAPPVAVLAAAVESDDEAEARRRAALAARGDSGIDVPHHSQSAPPPAALPAAPPAAGADAAAQRGFVELHVLDWLASHRNYPRAARRAGLEGTVHVRFVIDPDGRIADAAVERSSGARVLDRAALDLLGRASPVPGLAQFGLAQALELRLPIDYRLRRAARAG